MTKVDPRFRRASKKVAQVTVDGRFKAMFDDSEFTAPVKVDKYGRAISSDRERKDLERFYRLEKEEEEDTEEDAEEKTKEADTLSDSEASEPTNSETDSDDESSQSDQEYVMDQVLSNHPLVAQNIPTGEATRRLALVNMDWDQITADDIYTLFHGFKPITGSIISVTILPSEFGRERMKREALEGPPRELFEKQAGSEPEENESESEAESETEANITPQEDGEDFDSVALRKYQLERLRYYYAVVECDSVATAAHIYRSCDGSEFEKSANFIDLRYIPDSLTFDETDGTPKDICTELPKSYHAKPDLITSALQMSKVSLTWDADDCERARVTSRARVDQEEADLRAYLASSSEESEGEDAEKYRQLLLSGGDGNVFGRKGDKEGDELLITFSSALKTTTHEDDDEDVHMEATFTDEQPALTADMTPYDKYMARRKARKDAAKLPKEDRKKDKKSKKRALTDSKLELLVGGDLTEDEDQKIDVDVNDERFAAVFEEPTFALDPSNPAFKRTKGMDKIIKERQRRIHK